MTFVTMEELGNYVQTVGITPQILSQANSIVESIAGDISVKSVTDEVVKLNSRNIGKLKNVREMLPLVSINSVKSRGRTPFGITEEMLPMDSIDVSEFGYVTYYGGCGLSQMIFHSNPSALLVSYTYGYAVVPDELKMATSVIASSLVKRKMDGLKQLTDYDMTFVWTDDSIVSSDLRTILMKYKGV